MSNQFDYVYGISREGSVLIKLRFLSLSVFPVKVSLFGKSCKEKKLQSDDYKAKLKRADSHQIKWNVIAIGFYLKTAELVLTLTKKLEITIIEQIEQNSWVS